MEERRAIIGEEMGFVKEKVEECVGEAIREYLNSDEAGYPTAEQHLNSIIGLAPKHQQ